MELPQVLRSDKAEPSPTLLWLCLNTILSTCKLSGCWRSLGHSVYELSFCFNCVVALNAIVVELLILKCQQDQSCFSTFFNILVMEKLYRDFSLTCLSPTWHYSVLTLIQQVEVLVVTEGLGMRRPSSTARCGMDV